MTNTKTLTSAVAFLTAIAVLDNFLLVELKPEFEGMVLIESDAQADLGSPDESDSQVWSENNFWIDRQAISQADFAEFVAMTGYQSAKLAPQLEQQVADQPLELGIQLEEMKDSWRGDAQQLSSQHRAQVNYEDATAYCNWKGKQLPSHTQIENAARDARAGDSFKDGTDSLHHEDAGRRSWIGAQHAQGVITDSAVTSYHPVSKLFGFHCIRNISEIQTRS